MKILICGASTFENQLTFEDVQLALKKAKFKIKEIVTSEKKADNVLAYIYQEMSGLPLKEFPVMWDDISNCKVVKTNRWGKKYNPSAGFERTKKMVEYSDGVLAFWDELSAEHGTEHIVAYAKKIGKEVVYAKPRPEFIF